MSERHVLHITEADKLQIFLKCLHSQPSNPNREEPLLITDRRHVFAKANTTLLLGVQMDEFPYQATTQIFDFVVSEISKGVLTPIQQAKIPLHTQSIYHAETWNEGKYGFIVIG